MTLRNKIIELVNKGYSVRFAKNNLNLVAILGMGRQYTQGELAPMYQGEESIIELLDKLRKNL